MKEKKFKGFDDVHCPEDWKKDVLKEIDKPIRHVVSTWKYAMVILLLLLSIGGVTAAYHPAIKDWLSDVFSNEEETAVVEDHTPTLEDMGEITYLNATSSYYVKMNQEALYQADTFTIYQDGKEVSKDAQRLEKTVTLPVEQGTIDITFSYTILNGNFCPLNMVEDDTIEDFSLSQMPDGNQILIELHDENLMNSYVLDMQQDNIFSIGDLSLSDQIPETDGSHRLAYDVHTSKSGRYLLYRSNAVDGTWISSKEDQVWILYDAIAKTREIIDSEKLPGYLIGNEVILIGDDKLMTTEAITTKKSGVMNEESHPLVYNYLTKEWQSYPEYQVVTPLCSDMIWRIQDDEIEILNIETMRSSKIELPNETYDLDGSDLRLYPGFYVYESFGVVQQIYVVSQQRWVTINSDIANQLEEPIRFVYPENEHTLVLNQRYRIIMNDKQ